MRVYPRACGGTPAGNKTGRVSWGLSPRVRGNLFSSIESEPTLGSIPARAGEPHQADSQLSGTGSIPARAGEPVWHRLKKQMTKVYPRACGGTPIPARAGEPQH